MRKLLLSSSQVSTTISTEGITIRGEPQKILADGITVVNDDVTRPHKNYWPYTRSQIMKKLGPNAQKRLARLELARDASGAPYIVEVLQKATGSRADKVLQRRKIRLLLLGGSEWVGSFFPLHLAPSRSETMNRSLGRRERGLFLDKSSCPNTIIFF